MRYAYPKDRFNFAYWRRTKGPCDVRYWTFDHDTGRLKVQLWKAGHTVAQILTWHELQMYPRGWRSLVAATLRQLRRSLRK